MNFKKVIYLVLFASVLLCALSSCNKNTDNPTVPTVVEVKKIRYLALGDSYTIGQSVDASLRYPEQLTDSLRASGETWASTRIIATTGWSTADLQGAINNAKIVPDSTYSIVSLLIGVNNQYRGYSIETYRTEFAQLLSQAVTLAGGNKNHVFVVSIPDYAYTPFGNGNGTISAGIDQFNVVNKTITDAQGIKYFDITPISRQGLNDPALVASDGLHPSGKQYTQWTKLLWKEVKKLIVL
jgi:lysophospholipase L1-like esterase